MDTTPAQPAKRHAVSFDATVPEGIALDDDFHALLVERVRAEKRHRAAENAAWTEHKLRQAAARQRTSAA
jgi:hypothetical protein